MAGDKQDANLVGIYKTREAVLGAIPATADWFNREPNSFDSFGGEYSKTQRKPFSGTRQRKKGQTTDLDANVGYNEDLTQDNMKGELEEFFFAALRKTPSLKPSAVTATEFTIAANIGFQAGSLVLAKGYATQANNGVKELTAVSGTTLVAAGLVAEAVPPIKASVKEVGFAFATGDIVVSAPVGSLVLTATLADFTAMPLIPGQWVFFDLGDANVTQGYARIGVDGVKAKTLTFDKTTWPAAASAGAGFDPVIYFGDVIRNEDDPDNIVRFSSIIERTIGRDANGIQSEYVTGLVANELTWKSPLSDLVNLDMSYVGQQAGQRTGLEGPLSKRALNNVIPALSQDAFNTSSNVYRVRMAMVDPATLNPSPFFARITEWTGKVMNNVSIAKGQGVLGGFDTIVGFFEAQIELTAYFTTVEAIHAVKCNWDATFDAIYAKQNAGVYVDIPLLSPGGGQLEIEQDAAIMLPMTSDGAESLFGHTALIGWFDYLPDAAMPDIGC